MKLKLDENLGWRGAELLRAAGHDVATVREEGLCGASDPAVVAASAGEGRALLTLDLGFANPLAFNPAEYAGIAVLRLPARATLDHVDRALTVLVAALASRPLERRLWIVELGRVREYQQEWSPEDDGS